jgi:hypothetical protein
MSAVVKPHRSTKELAAMERKAAKFPRAVDIVSLCILDRSEKYRIALVLRECDGSQYVAALGQMRGMHGKWVRARTFNFRADEIDEVIDALERAREILS